MAAIPAAFPLSTAMKKFIVFILVLSLLIIAEYYFLTEFFTQRRVPVILICLMAIIGCLYGLSRFFSQRYFSS
jgi:heme/copper-type cytochrome/quinol oxidase subunit 4